MSERKLDECDDREQDSHLRHLPRTIEPSGGVRIESYSRSTASRTLLSIFAWFAMRSSTSSELR